MRPRDGRSLNTIHEQYHTASVGDPEIQGWYARREYCHTEDNGFICTRLPHSYGQHVAEDDEIVVATWPHEDDEDR